MDELRQRIPTYDDIQRSIPTAENVREGIENVVNTVQQGAETVRTNVTNSINDFSSQSAVGASESFLNSNSIIAKFVFIILSVIVFFVLGYLGIKLVFYFSQPSRRPYVVKGTISGSSNLTIPQGSATNNETYIYRSNNQKGGLECTWSIWLNVNNLPKLKGSKPTYSHIFNKGGNNFTPEGLAIVNNAIGMYITTDDTGTNGVLQTFMDTQSYNVQNLNNNFVAVNNIPLQKWFHVAVRIQNSVMDVYINGTIAGRTVFTETPKQNYDDINIGHNNGFSGSLSDLRYFDYALSVFNINNIILIGPSLFPSQLSPDSTTSNTSYLSSYWNMNHL